MIWSLNVQTNQKAPGAIKTCEKGVPQFHTQSFFGGQICNQKLRQKLDIIICHPLNP